MTGLLYLPRADVERALESIDCVRVVSEALALHARGAAWAPPEAYLAWTPVGGGSARSIGMPGALGDSLHAVGIKVINANAANVSRGLPRASGLTILFDDRTAEPIAVLEAARISAVRTAAVTVVAAELLAVAPVERVGLLGAGELARAHVELLGERLVALRELRVFDVHAGRAERLAESASRRRVDIVVASSAADAVREAGLVVTATTATTSYIPHAWLHPGTVVVNVSLDDLLPEVYLRADRLVVDDWPLIAADSNRLLGRLAASARVVGPGCEPPPGARAVDASLGELVRRRGGLRASDREIIVVNPFGLAIEDVAVARRVYDLAVERGLGLVLER